MHNVVSVTELVASHVQLVLQGRSMWDVVLGIQGLVRLALLAQKWLMEIVSACRFQILLVYLRNQTLDVSGSCQEWIVWAKALTFFSLGRLQQSGVLSWKWIPLLGQLTIHSHSIGLGRPHVLSSTPKQITFGCQAR
jgi:hypothetical protein